MTNLGLRVSVITGSSAAPRLSVARGGWRRSHAGTGPTRTLGEVRAWLAKLHQADAALPRPMIPLRAAGGSATGHAAPRRVGKNSSKPDVRRVPVPPGDED